MFILCIFPQHILATMQVNGCRTATQKSEDHSKANASKQTSHRIWTVYRVSLQLDSFSFLCCHRLRLVVVSIIIVADWSSFVEYNEQHMSLQVVYCRFSRRNHSVGDQYGIRTMWILYTKYPILQYIGPKKNDNRQRRQRPGRGLWLQWFLEMSSSDTHDWCEYNAVRFKIAACIGSIKANEKCIFTCWICISRECYVANHISGWIKWAKFDKVHRRTIRWRSDKSIAMCEHTPVGAHINAIQLIRWKIVMCLELSCGGSMALHLCNVMVQASLERILFNSQ